MTTDPASVQIVFDKELDQVLLKFPQLINNNMLANIRRGMAKHRKAYLSKIRGKFGTSGRFSLARQFFFDTSDPGTPVERMQAAWFTDSKAAEGLEKGGEIRPQNANYLTIPIAHARSKSGRVKKKYRAIKTTLSRLAERGRLFYRKRGKTLTAYQVIGPKKNRRVVPIYLLTPKITVEPVLEFFASWARNEARFQSFMADAITATLEGKKIPLRVSRVKRRASR